MIDPDLERARESFLRQLEGEHATLQGQDAFAARWKQVENEARHSEDVGQLHSWLSELRRDRDRLEALKAKKQSAASSQVGADAAVHVIHLLLALLDDLEKKLRQRLHFVQDLFENWLLVVGLGVKRKPKPKTEEEKKGEADRKAPEAVLAKPPKTEPAKPTKQKGV